METTGTAQAAFHAPAPACQRRAGPGLCGLSPEMAAEAAAKGLPMLTDSMHNLVIG